MKDVKPAYDNVPYAFIGAPAIMSKQLVKDKLNESGISVEETEHVFDLLVWFGVLGIYLADEEERYSYQFEHDPKRMMTGLTNFAYCVHPAFRVALGTTQ
jgi:hypothetical protein